MCTKSREVSQFKALSPHNEDLDGVKVILLRSDSLPPSLVGFSLCACTLVLAHLSPEYGHLYAWYMLHVASKCCYIFNVDGLTVFLVFAG